MKGVTFFGNVQITGKFGQVSCRELLFSMIYSVHDEDRIWIRDEIFAIGLDMDSSERVG